MSQLPLSYGFTEAHSIKRRQLKGDNHAALSNTHDPKVTFYVQQLLYSPQQSFLLRL
jgi:hypothetical protein